MRSTTGPPGIAEARAPRDLVEGLARARRRACGRAARCGPPRRARARRGRPRRRGRGRDRRPGAAARPPARRNAEKRWPSRWLTPTSGMPRANASALPAERPTSSAPIRPGPAVAATSPTSSSRTPGARERLLEHGGQVLEVRARGDLGHDAAVAARAPRICDETTFERTRPSPSRIAAEVSSQEVSMPRTSHAARWLAPPRRRRLSPYGGRQMPRSVTIAVT